MVKDQQPNGVVRTVVNDNRGSWEDNLVDEFAELPTVQFRSLPSSGNVNDDSKNKDASTTTSSNPIAVPGMSPPQSLVSSPNPVKNPEIQLIRLDPNGVKNVEHDVDGSHHIHTEFTVEVQLTHGLKWFIAKRYSDFRDFHEKLKKTHTAVKCLHFPKRHLFRSKSQSVIQNRRAELEVYCTEILAIRPLLKLPIFTFFEVYVHLECYERRQVRKKKQNEIDRMKMMLDPVILNDLISSFGRLNSSKTTSGRTSALENYDVISSSPSPGVQTSSSVVHSITKSCFKRDVLGIFPDIPSSFATKFIKACSDKHRNDISSDEFARSVAILMEGSLSDKLSFLFQMADHDHYGKLHVTGISNILLALHGNTFIDRKDVRTLLRDIFEARRLSVVEFVTNAAVSYPIASEKLLVSWMKPFAQILIQNPNKELLDLQEECNPLAQQRILTNETRFTTAEIEILQDAYNLVLSESSIESMEEDEKLTSVLNQLSDAFPVDLSNKMLHKVFSSCGKRAKFECIDIFSFVSCLDIACRGSPEEQAAFAFKLFESGNKGFLVRDNLFEMIQHDLSLKFIKTDTELLILESLRATQVGKSSSKEDSSWLSGSQVGSFVDQIIETYGHSVDNEWRLKLDQFTSWTVKASFHVGLLDILKFTVFVELGLRPCDVTEEAQVASLCYSEYPATPHFDLIEDDNWYLLDGKWFEHWCTYVDFPHKDELLPFGPEDEDEGPKSPFKMKSVNLMIPDMISFTRPPPQPTNASETLDLSNTKPKYISNSSLLDSKNATVVCAEQELKRREKITQGKDFVIICERLWLALKSWYGGGPEIRRKVCVLSDGSHSLDIWGDEEEALLRQAVGGDESSLMLRRMSEDKASFKSSSSVGGSVRRLRAGGSSGLINLGNTCFLNAALQCLCNTSLLAEYFLSGIYMEDINRTSTLGLQGKLAEAYGKLMCDLWGNAGKSKSVSATMFKKMIGKLNEDFSGCEQQDAQELLAYLLSGLSEDLNRIHDKPYVEQPDSDGRCDPDLADEWWRNHLRREVSIIVALFTGQFKSLLTCPSCNYESARFEPFTFLQVPLPEPTHHDVSIRLELATGAAPKRILVKLPIASTIADLRLALVSFCNKELSMKNVELRDIVIAEVSGSYIIGYKADSRRVAQIRSIDRLVAYQLNPTELLRTRFGVGDEVEVVRRKSKSLDTGKIISIKPCSLSDEGDGKIFGIRFRNGSESSVPSHQLKLTCLKVHIVSRKVLYLSSYFKDPFRPAPFGSPFIERVFVGHTTGYELYCRVWNRVKRFASVLEPEKLPINVDVPPVVVTDIKELFTTTKSNPCGFTLRRVDASTLTSDPRSPWLLRSFGCTIPCSDSVIDIADDEKIVIDWDAHVLQDSVDMDELKNVETYQQDSAVELSESGHENSNGGGNGGPVPLNSCLQTFASEERIDEGYCSGCKSHHELTKKLDIWRLPPVLVVHMKRFQYTQTYRRKLSSLVEFPLYDLSLDSLVAPIVEEPKPYAGVAAAPSTSTEAEASNDATARKTNSSETDSDTKNGVRSKIRRGYTDTNLDESRCLNTQYDLYGVVNHLGALGGGHYTAYCKNSVDGHWYCYDDDRVRLMEESKVVTADAYILFYIRTDMENMPISELFPANRKAEITQEDIEFFVEQGDQRKCSVM